MLKRTNTDTKQALPRTDTNAALNFLKTLRPQGPWVLTAIVPDGETKTRSFKADNEEAVRDFIETKNRDQNIYFTGNLCGRPSKKPTKAAMTGGVMLHTDDDPRDGETPEQAKTRILAAYAEHEPPPSIIIDSGNGLQGLWMLDKDYEVLRVARDNLSRADKDRHVEQRVAEIEDRNRALAAAIGSPSGTHNIDRLLRLPGTINYPNKAKREKGRVVCQASIVQMTDARYPLEQFIKDFGPDEQKKSSNGHDENNFEAFANEQRHDLDLSGSGYGYRFMQNCHAEGMTFEQARTAILLDKNEAGEWARRSDKRQLDRAWKNSKPEQQKFEEEPVDLWNHFEPPALPHKLLPKVIEDYATPYKARPWVSIRLDLPWQPWRFAQPQLPTASNCR